MGPWVQPKLLEKANLGFEQGTIGAMRARPWTPLSTMPPPGEAWSIAMHKQSSTHQMVYPNVAKDVSGQSTAHKHPPCWAGVCVWQMRFGHKLLFLQKMQHSATTPHTTLHYHTTTPHTTPHTQLNHYTTPPTSHQNSSMHVPKIK